jgi:cell division protein FtsA
MKTNRSQLITSLDIGTHKICCLVAETDGESIRILGGEVRESAGVQRGQITNLDTVVGVIIQTLAAAEEQVKQRFKKVMVNSGHYQLFYENVSLRLMIHGREITSTDLKQALAAEPSGVDVSPLHRVPISFHLDGEMFEDPRGMHAGTLETRLGLISMPAKAARNLQNCLGRAHLLAEQVVVDPLAAAHVCLGADERSLGCLLIDMGAGVTRILAYKDNKPVLVDAIPLGGDDLTNDIARGLSTPLVEAERIKILYGAAMNGLLGDRDMLDVPLLGEQGNSQHAHIPRSYLLRIVQPRLEEIFELVRGKLNDAGMYKSIGRLCVLTGGACGLPGMADAASVWLDRKVTIASSPKIAGLHPDWQNPAFHTALGLLYAKTRETWFYDRLPEHLHKPQGQSVWHKGVRWLVDHF